MTDRDADVVYIMNWCRAIGAKVYVRGTDERPVIVVTEIRRRMQYAIDQHK